MNTHLTTFTDGLWKNNQALVALLGLCPLLAVTSTAINGLGLGFATLVVLLLSNTTVSAIRHIIRPEVRLPVYVLLIASFVTAVELSMKAWLYDLYLVLGIFIPLIVTNCSIIGRAEAFASKNTIAKSILDALGIGLGFTTVLFVLGSLRELAGQGTLLANADLMFGSSAANWGFVISENFKGMLLAMLPPGAFFGLGFLIAIKNIIDKRVKKPVAIPRNKDALRDG